MARNALLQIRSTGDVPLEQVPSWKFWHHPKKLKSTEWLLEVMAQPELADTRPIFLIHHPELISELKLQDKGVEKSGLRYYTFNEIQPVLSEDLRPGRARRRNQGRAAHYVPEAGSEARQRRHAVSAAQDQLQPEGVADFSREMPGVYQSSGGGAGSRPSAAKTAPILIRAALERVSRPMQTFAVDGSVCLCAGGAAGGSRRVPR